LETLETLGAKLEALTARVDDLCALDARLRAVEIQVYAQNRLIAVVGGLLLGILVKLIS
jgi:hypothetical protein